MNLIDTLHNALTPAILIDEHAPASLDTPQKTAVLGSLYALLGTWLHDKANSPLASLADGANPDTLTEFFGEQTFTPFYETLAQHHAIPSNDIKALALVALPKAHQALGEMAQGASVAEFLRPYFSPAYAPALLAVLPTSLHALVPSTDTSPTADTSTHTPNAHAPNAQPTSTPKDDTPQSVGAFAKGFLPLVALLITGLVAWLLLKGCQKEPTAIATPTVQLDTKTPAVLSLQFDQDGQALMNCTGTAHNSLLAEKIIGQIAQTLPADTCRFNAETGASDVPALQYLPQILGFAKGVPNARLDITGKTITLSGTDEASLTTLKNKLINALPNDFAVNAELGLLEASDAKLNDHQPSQTDTENTDTTEQGADTQTADTQAGDSQTTEPAQPSESSEPSEPVKSEQTDTAKDDSNALVQESLDNAKTALSALKADNPDELIKALNLQIINFATNSAHIPADNKAILDMAVKHLKDNDIKITITGHTDNRGEPDGNKLLSEARARAVRDYLVAQGVNPKSLRVVGKGDSEPAFDNNTEEGRFKNRRIEFSLRK